MKNEASGARDETPRLVPRVAAWVQCGDKFETRKSDSGTGRSGTQESGTGDIPRRACPFHARSKCAANPCSRTFRNARTRHIRWEQPRRRSASRRLGNARGAASSLRPDNLSHCSDETCEDCRYDRPDKARFFTPGKSAKRIMEREFNWQVPSARSCASMYNGTI